MNRLNGAFLSFKSKAFIDKALSLTLLLAFTKNILILLLIFKISFAAFNQLIQIYNTINKYQISNKKQLEEDMRKAGLNKITTIEVKGFIFAIGWIE